MAKDRPAVIIGNWKMYKTNLEAENYIKELLPKISDTSKMIYIAAPFTAIQILSRLTKDSSVKIGAQNMNDAEEGAFTGEIAAKMLVDAGCEFVLLGHSERRKIFHETNAFINRKVIKALKANLQPILCIGEDEKERDEGKTDEVVKSQLYESLTDIKPKDVSKMMIAYEPVWAIGTGHTATAEIAEDEHAKIRSMIKEKWGDEAAKNTILLYGGSVRSDNVEAILQMKNIDGVLVGNASLNPDTFNSIIHYENQKVNQVTS